MIILQMILLVILGEETLRYCGIEMMSVFGMNVMKILIFLGPLVQNYVLSGN